MHRQRDNDGIIIEIKRIPSNPSILVEMILYKKPNILIDKIMMKILFILIIFFIVKPPKIYLIPLSTLKNMI